jgi:mannose-1-phosphate guanylyltransferase
MAGGKGARFWPLSRASRPKQLLDIVGDKTMIQQTIERVSALVPEQNIIIVTGQDHADILKSQVPAVPASNIIIESFSRNTAPCICLAALTILERSGDNVMVVLPADHHIGNSAAFCHYIKAACAAAQSTSCLIAVGISPSKPETGYGYIQMDKSAGQYLGKDFYHVSAFHEKPTPDRARQFLNDGGYLWNSGMFVWRVSSILQAVERHLPDVYSELKSITPPLSETNSTSAIREAYSRIRSVSIDYGVMEHADNVLTVKADFDWNDIGSWSAVYDVLPKDINDNAVTGNAISIDSRQNYVHSPKRLTALVGVENLVIVDTDDALLVCARDKAQDVKRVVEDLEARNKKRIL